MLGADVSAREARTAMLGPVPRGRHRPLDVLTVSPGAVSRGLSTIGDGALSAYSGRRLRRVTGRQSLARCDPYLSTWLTRGSPANGRNSSKNSIAAGV
jgi:hypothetical protein